MDDVTKAKKVAGEEACTFVKDGMTVGLGTGSTAEWAVKRLGELRLDIKCVPTSKGIHELAESVGLEVISFEDFNKQGLKIDLDIDGADRIDPEFNLIKGGGGCQTREKAVAKASRQFFVVADDSKLVKRLLGSFPIAVEVLPQKLNAVEKALSSYGKAKLRDFTTDNGNKILDLEVESNLHETDLNELEESLNLIDGVIDNGLFTFQRPQKVFISHLGGAVDVLEI